VALRIKLYYIFIYYLYLSMCNWNDWDIYLL